MKVKGLLKFYLPAVAVAMGVGSCQDYNADFSEEALKKEQFAEQFQKMFGKIDPQQDWNMATQVVANVNTDIPVSVSIYNVSPINNNSVLLTSKQNVGNGASIKFDVPKYYNKVYVVANRDGIDIKSDYYDVADGKVDIALSSLSTRAASNPSPVRFGAAFTDAYMDKFQDNHNYWPLLHINEHNSDINFNKLYSTYPLMGVVTTDGGSVMISDIDAIVGKGGVFNERNDERTECNLSKWYSELNAENGAEYILAEDGPVEFDIMYGGTVKHNQIGYFYYSDGTPYEKAIRMPHYVIGSCRPQDNVKVNDVAMATGDGMRLPALVQSYDTSGEDAKLTGTHYKLTYFGESGLDEENASYTFKAGTHVVFFMVQNGINVENSYGYNIENSVPKFNAFENKYWLDNADDHGINRWVHSGDKATCPQLTGEIDAVTYRWGGMTILGFEDRDEDDMNDILFFIHGKFSNEIKELKEEIDTYEWMVACEDLGSTDDYDFNDVVFGVKHYKSSKTMYSKYYDEEGKLVSTGLPVIIDKENYLMVTPKAAGGTLKSNVYYDERNLGEIHTLLNVDAKDTYDSMESGSMPILNARTLSYTGTPVIIKLDDDEEFSMAHIENGVKSIAKFSIKVEDKNEAVKISAPDAGEAPQMLILPIGWDWPTEQTPITTAYPEFKTWVSTAEENGWITYCAGPVITNPVKHYDGDGSGGGEVPPSFDATSGGEVSSVTSFPEDEYTNCEMTTGWNNLAGSTTAKYFKLVISAETASQLTGADAYIVVPAGKAIKGSFATYDTAKQTVVVNNISGGSDLVYKVSMNADMVSLIQTSTNSGNPAAYFTLTETYPSNLSSGISLYMDYKYATGGSTGGDEDTPIDLTQYGTEVSLNSNNEISLTDLKNITETGPIDVTVVGHVNQWASGNAKLQWAKDQGYGYQVVDIDDTYKQAAQTTVAGGETVVITMTMSAEDYNNLINSNGYQGGLFVSANNFTSYKVCVKQSSVSARKRKIARK